PDKSRRPDGAGDGTTRLTRSRSRSSADGPIATVRAGAQRPGVEGPDEQQHPPTWTKYDSAKWDRWSRGRGHARGSLAGRHLEMTDCTKRAMIRRSAMPDRVWRELERWQATPTPATGSGFFFSPVNGAGFGMKRFGRPAVCRAMNVAGN